LDIATSVTDASSPLTIHEYDEWGYVQSSDESTNISQNPEEEGIESDPLQVLQVIKSYSPCCNIHHLCLLPSAPAVVADLPSVMITVGLQDDKVDPRESFKWISLLRKKYSELGNTSSPLLLNVRQGEGHEGGSTVEDQCRDTAIEIAFLEKEIYDRGGRGSGSATQLERP
jgi:oligopeptidase B